MKSSRGQRSRRLVAFGLSGLLWVGTYELLNLGLTDWSDPFGWILEVYVVAGTLVIGFSGRRFTRALIATCMTAIVLLFAIITPIDPPAWPLALALGALYGSLAFLAWAATAGAILTFIGGADPDRGPWEDPRAPDSATI